MTAPPGPEGPRNPEATAIVTNRVFAASAEGTEWADDNKYRGVRIIRIKVVETIIQTRYYGHFVFIIQTKFGRD